VRHVEASLVSLVLPATLDEHDGDTFVEDGFVFVVS
jgi:hypothetical protein